MNLFNKSSSQVRSILFAVFILAVSLEVIESRFMVKTLPGFDGDLPFTLETGYYGVGESEAVQYFYYFIESEGNPKDDPLIFWLTGGPGCSVLSGLLYQIGPIAVNYANSTLEKATLEINPYSWTKAANILFLDQPAGSGFSYAKTPEAYIVNDTLASINAYHFLKKWLIDHPKFINNPFYVGADSYMGIVMPSIVEEIYNGNEVGDGQHINIKGYMLGNPFTNRSADYNSRITFAHRMALLSDEIYTKAHDSCGGEFLNVNPNNGLCLDDLQVVDKCLEKIHHSHILEPYCVTPNSINSDALLRRDLRALDKTSFNTPVQPPRILQGCRDDNYVYSEVWANSKEVREALHISEEFGNTEWVRCNVTLVFVFGGEDVSYTHNFLSSVGNHQRLSHKNCRALVYSGDHDLNIPYLGTLNWIKSLNVPVVDEWRPWIFDDQVAGYTTKFSKDMYSLTYATVKGGGHTAAEYKPKECLSMFKKWLADDPL